MPDEKEVPPSAGAASPPQPEGDLNCILIFSDSAHVDYIYPLLSQIEQELKVNRFKPIRLSDEVKSGDDYLKKITGLINESVLGVVVLDGFRPNVLFEFGLPAREP